jgi:hypothetical protein
MDESSRTMWTFEPRAAEQIFDWWLRENGIQVVSGARLDRQSRVKKEGARIAGISTLDGTSYRGRMFIDATYEGTS